MAPRVTEAAAWRLLRAVSRDARAADCTVRDHYKPSSGVSLHVAPGGAWRTSPPASGAARDLLDLYLPLLLDPCPVIGQIGQSLDGRIATENGHSHYVTGPADIRRLHRLRALADAVIVGAGTVAADDPHLTVREVEGENPVRVVLDPNGRLPPDRAVFRDGAARTLVVRRAPAGRGRPAPDRAGFHDGSAQTVAAQSAPAGRGGARPTPNTLELPADAASADGGVAPAEIVAALRARGLSRILVEGGGVTVSRFLAAGVLTRLHVTVAPLLIGSGRHALTLPPIPSLDRALRPRCRRFPLGDDMLFDLDLR